MAQLPRGERIFDEAGNVLDGGYKCPIYHELVPKESESFEDMLMADAQERPPGPGALWPHHLGMARMVAAGVRPSELVRFTGFSATQISQIMASPLFQTEVNRILKRSEDVAVNLRGQALMLAQRGLECISEDLHMEISDSLDARKIRQNAAFGILKKVMSDKQDGSAVIKADHVTVNNIENMSVSQVQNEINALLEME